MAKPRITQTTQYDSPGHLPMPKFSAKFQRGHPPSNGAPNRGGRGEVSVIFDKYLAISQKRCKIGSRDIVIMEG